MSWYYREPYEAVGDNAGTNTCQSPGHQQVGGRLSSVLQVISRQSTLRLSGLVADQVTVTTTTWTPAGKETTPSGDTSTVLTTVWGTRTAGVTTPGSTRVTAGPMMATMVGQG